MIEDSVRIDRLVIRLRGVPPAPVRAAASGIAAELASGLAAMPPPSRERRDVRIERVRVPAGASPGAIAAAVAGAVSTALRAREV